MPALLDPETEARLQRAMTASVLPHYLVGADAQLRNLDWLIEWLQSLPVGLVVDPVYIPIFLRLAVPLGALYDPALLARAKALYLPFWEALATILEQAPDVRLGLEWPPTPARLYDTTTRYLQQRGLLGAEQVPQRRDVGAVDLDRAAYLAQVGLAQLAQVIDDARHERATPVFGPVARTIAQHSGVCDLRSPSSSPYLVVASVARDGRVFALLTFTDAATRDTLLIGHLGTAPDGSYIIETGTQAERSLYPRAFGDDPESVATLFRAAVEAIRRGRPWQMGMQRVALSDLPDDVAASLLQSRLPPPYYGVYFDECDAAPLLAAARGDLGRSATEALYPPHSLLQASAARIAQNESDTTAALESGVLPDELRDTVASYALLHACDSDQPPNAGNLAPAAALIGIDANRPVYRSSPSAFCGDVWTTLDGQVQRRASTQPGITAFQEPQGNTSEPSRSRQRLF